MAGSSSSVLVVAILAQLCDQVQLGEACDIECPPNEIICSCPDGKPKPTSEFVDSCDGYIYYCSDGGKCKPENNGCPVGEFTSQQA